MLLKLLKMLLRKMSQTKSIILKSIISKASVKYELASVKNELECVKNDLEFGIDYNIKYVIK